LRRSTGSWYNTQRLLEPIGYVPPIEYEEHYYRSQPTHAMVAESPKQVSGKPGAVQCVRIRVRGEFENHSIIEPHWLIEISPLKVASHIRHGNDGVPDEVCKVVHVQWVAHVVA